jgi:hypothetical protein
MYFHAFERWLAGQELVFILVSSTTEKSGVLFVERDVPLGADGVAVKDGLSLTNEALNFVLFPSEINKFSLNHLKIYFKGLFQKLNNYVSKKNTQSL